MPPSPELQPAPDGRAFLAAIAQRTGGRVLSLDDPGTVFDASAGTGTPLRHYQPVWFVPLGLALVLLLAELGWSFSRACAASACGHVALPSR
ncbi:MAG: hypothetical protein C4346_12220 [Chloroflexota bacterium]